MPDAKATAGTLATQLTGGFDSVVNTIIKGVRRGQVISSSSGPPKTVTVKVGAAATNVPMRYQAGYTPVNGDFGLVLVMEGANFFIGPA